MSLQKWKDLADKRRLVEQYYKEKDNAIKDYKFRRGVSSDLYERVAKPVTEKISEQIKKQEEQAEKITKNIIKTLMLTSKQRGFLLQNQQREQDSKQVGIHIRCQRIKNMES